MRSAPFRLRLPDWVTRTLSFCGPGRPLAPSQDALARGLSLCPATAQALMHPTLASAWRAWSEPEAI